MFSVAAGGWDLVTTRQVPALLPAASGVDGYGGECLVSEGYRERGGDMVSRARI